MVPGTVAMAAGIIVLDVKKITAETDCSALINNYNGGAQ